MSIAVEHDDVVMPIGPAKDIGGAEPTIRGVNRDKPEGAFVEATKMFLKFVSFRGF